MYLTAQYSNRRQQHKAPLHQTTKVEQPDQQEKKQQAGTIEHSVVGSSEAHLGTKAQVTLRPSSLSLSLSSLQQRRRKNRLHSTDQQNESELALRYSSTDLHNCHSDTRVKDSTKSHLAMATVRPISPQYQHTLDSAISLAKELASKNIADSGESSPKTPNSPDKKRFNFKLKHFGKSFSEASANIRDIESSISYEAKQAYKSLIERGPFNSSSLSYYGNHRQSNYQHHHHAHYANDVDDFSPTSPTLTPAVCSIGKQAKHHSSFWK